MSIRLSRVLLALLVISGCGGGANEGVRGTDEPTVAQTSGVAVVKLRTAGSAWVAMTEKLAAIANVTRPDRRLLMAPEGARPTAAYVPPAGWSLVDFAVHPSGQTTALLASDEAIRLVRLDARGQILSTPAFVDPRVGADPFIGDLLSIRKPEALVPYGTRDAARVAAIGEDLSLALRSGRNAVIAYRLRHAAEAGFELLWRTVVEPGVFVAGIALPSGIFDPIGGLDNQWQVSMDADAEGRLAVAVSIDRTDLAYGHSAYFGEQLGSSLTHGALVTLIDQHGNRAGTTVLDTATASGVHVVRWAGDKVAIGGRVRTGSGWDAWVAVVDPRDRRVVHERLLDVDRDDIVFDLAPVGAGQLLLAGSAGYTQQLYPASVSEEADPMLLLVDLNVGRVQRLALPRAPRHNQVRSVAAWKGNWLAGGLQNGPGTHTSPAMLAADGYVREVRVP